MNLITEVAELEAENKQLDREVSVARNLASLAKGIVDEQSDRIRELEDRLVEERIAGEFSDWIENQCPHWDIDEEPFCSKLDGPCEHREGKCPIRGELHDMSRQQLISEGKLRPDDKSSQPAEMSSCQMMLTKEQQEALEAIRDLVTAETRSDYIDNAVDVLDALLSSAPPAWEVTEERKNALKWALDAFNVVGDEEASVVLRAMLDEARP